jgi:transposase
MLLSVVDDGCDAGRNRAMAMGKRKRRQESLFVATADLARSPGHPFYRKLNELLAEAEFDRWIEGRCEPYYEAADKPGRESIPPGTYFRMLLVGYFEEIESQRGIAWRCGDSRSLAEFLNYGQQEATPDHSTLSITRKRLPPAMFDEVFQFVLKIADEKRLLSGKTVGVDSTTLEANAAMKSILRRDTGEDWKQYVGRLMKEEGIVEEQHEPTDEEIRRFDQGRKNKKVSNDEWVSPVDPEARITQLKDGRTHLAYKAEHVVDLDSDLILAAEIRPANHGDSQTLCDSVLKAQENLQGAEIETEIEEVAADKGYHSAGMIELCDSLGLRTYIPEPKHAQDRTWTDKAPELQRAVYENRRRMRRAKGKRLGRLRSERVERSFAHVCDSGGMRRSWLRGLVDVTKRYLIAAAAHNLGRILRRLFGVGKPKSLQGLRAPAVITQLTVTTLRITTSSAYDRFIVSLNCFAIPRPRATTS